jgi:hypothetical protein
MTQTGTPQKSKKRVRRRAVPKERPQKKNIIVRFRVTKDEIEVIRKAAEYDYQDIAVEISRRGLDYEKVSSSIRSPSEWARMIVVNIAEKKLRERGVSTPWQERRAQLLHEWRTNEETRLGRIEMGEISPETPPEPIPG